MKSPENIRAQMSQAQLVKYLENKRVADGNLPGTVYALRPFDTRNPGRAVVVVYEVNNVLLGETLYAPENVNWKSRRPRGVLYQA